MTIGLSADGAFDLELRYREGMSPVRRPSNLPGER